MSRRILIVEPDASSRAMMERALTTEGFAADVTASIHDAVGLLDSGQLELVLMDELGASRAALEEVRWLRRTYPTLPIIVTGAVLSRREMIELLRLRVADALAKPFSPAELRQAVRRVTQQNTARYSDALEYDAAVMEARRALAAGLPSHARSALGRARATSPFDAEAMALSAFLAEIEGDDGCADRGYRAALALRDDEASPPPDPREGLARLDAYGGARPVAALDPRRGEQPIRLVTDPIAELGAASASSEIVLVPIGLTADGASAIFFRDGDGPRAFALMAGAARPEPIGAALAQLGTGPLVMSETTRRDLDLARVEALRAAHRGAPRRSDGVATETPNGSTP